MNNTTTKIPSSNIKGRHLRPTGDLVVEGSEKVQSTYCYIPLRGKMTTLIHRDINPFYSKSMKSLRGERERRIAILDTRLRPIYSYLHHVEIDL